MELTKSRLVKIYLDHRTSPLVSTKAEIGKPSGRFSSLCVIFVQDPETPFLLALVQIAHIGNPASFASYHRLDFPLPCLITVKEPSLLIFASFFFADIGSSFHANGCHQTSSVILIPLRSFHFVTGPKRD